MEYDVENVVQRDDISDHTPHNSEERQQKCNDKLSRHRSVSFSRDPMDDDSPKKKIYIGRIAGKCTETDIHDLFSKFGDIERFDFRGRFAFITYVNNSSALKAVKEMDDTLLFDEKISVEVHRSVGRRIHQGPPKHQIVLPPPGKPAELASSQKRTQFRISAKNLDERVSWQDLKDFGRNVGEVNFTNVFRRRGKKEGVIEYFDYETSRKALKNLDGKQLYDKAVYLSVDDNVEHSDRPRFRRYPSRGSNDSRRNRSGSEIRHRYKSRDGYENSRSRMIGRRRDRSNQVRRNPPSISADNDNFTKAKRSLDGDRDKYRDKYPDRHRDGYPDRHRDGYPDRHRDGYPDRHRDGYPDRHRDGYPDRHRDRDIDRRGDRDIDRRGDRDIDRRGDRDRYPEKHTDRHFERHQNRGMDQRREGSGY